MEDSPQMLSHTSLDPISRPSSTSTSASASLAHLPGIQTLAAVNAAAAAAPNSPQLKEMAAPPQQTMYTGATPAATNGGGSNLPTCQNCSTSTTPLWRRDEFGSVLCNACGLFLKLHGRPRPISLKTDVIKSRNRVKTMRPDMAPKKKQLQQAQNFPMGTDPNGIDLSGQSAAQAAQAARRTSGRSNGHGDGADSPISRNGTPSMYNHSLPSFMVDDPYQTNGFGNDGRAGSPMNGDRSLDAPMTHEQLIATNSSLKTRVSELEVINELFRGRLSQLEQQEAAARRGQEVAGAEQSQLRAQLEAAQESERQLRNQLEDSHRRENILKRCLDDVELEVRQLKDTNKHSLEASPERPAKIQRIERFDEPIKETDPKLSEEFAAPEEVKEASEHEEAPTTSEHIEAQGLNEPVAPVEPVVSPELIASDEPTEPMELVEPVEPVEPVALVETVESVDPVEQLGQVEADETAKTDDATDSAQATS